jgi:hypothetical protein
MLFNAKWSIHASFVLRDGMSDNCDDKAYLLLFLLKPHKDNFRLLSFRPALLLSSPFPLVQYKSV